MPAVERPQHYVVRSFPVGGNEPRIVGRWETLGSALYQARFEYAAPSVRAVDIVFVASDGLRDRVALYRKDSALAVCTSDDPNDHQGDTCPVHEL